MTPELAVMLDAYRAGLNVWPDPDKPGRVMVRPADKVTPDLAARIRKHKNEIVRIVPSGWQRDAWIERLRQLADRCERWNADRACELREWANRLTELDDVPF